MVTGKNTTIAAAKMPKVAPPPIALSAGVVKNGVTYDMPFRNMLKTKLASAP